MTGGSWLLGWSVGCFWRELELQPTTNTTRSTPRHATAASNMYVRHNVWFSSITTAQAAVTHDTVPFQSCLGVNQRQPLSAVAINNGGKTQAQPGVHASTNPPTYASTLRQCQSAQASQHNNISHGHVHVRGVRKTAPIHTRSRRQLVVKEGTKHAALLL